MGQEETTHVSVKDPEFLLYKSHTQSFLAEISPEPTGVFSPRHWHRIQMPFSLKTGERTYSEFCPQILRQACLQENPEGAMCVQNLNDSRGLAIRITYRISLRSSSLWEPRHPPLKVVCQIVSFLVRAGML